MKDQGSFKRDFSIQQEENKADKTEIAGKTFIIKKNKEKNSLHSIYYEYFNEEIDHSLISNDASNHEIDESIITMIEKQDAGSRSAPEIDQETEKEEDNEEEIQTFRVSNPVTPIPDLDKNEEIDESRISVLLQKANYINNLLYGNFASKFNDKSRQEKISTLRSDSRVDSKKA